MSYIPEGTMLVDSMTVWILVGCTVGLVVMVALFLVNEFALLPKPAKIMRSAKMRKKGLTLAEFPDGNAYFYLNEKVAPSGYIETGGPKKKRLHFVLPHIFSMDKESKTVTNNGAQTNDKELTETEREATQRLFTRNTFLPEVGVPLYVGSAKKCTVSSINALSALQNKKEFSVKNTYKFFTTKLDAVNRLFTKLYTNDWIKAAEESAYRQGFLAGSKRFGNDKYQWIFPLIVILALVVLIGALFYFMQG